MKLLLLLGTLMSISHCEIEAARQADRVVQLPGLDDPQPTFNHYAGHLNATDGKQLFYWFIESENDPTNDPLALWLNGGPGCSSLTGLLLEMGPWRVKPNGTGLTWFEDRWTKISNMLFIEAPAGVGYSYDENDNYIANDDTTAYYNYMALKDFFNGFPEFASNEFFVTGESYAGTYVPTLSELVMEDSDINFKGFAVGNPVTNRETMANGLIYFSWARGLFSTQQWDKLVEECCVNGNTSDCNFYDNSNAQCTLEVIKVNGLVWGSGMNPYNIYGSCDGGVPRADGYLSGHDKPTLILPETLSYPKIYRQEYEKYFKERVEFYQEEGDVPCTDPTDRNIYLRSDEVKEALHIPDHVHDWTFCSNMVSGNYTVQYTDLSPQYYNILSKGHRAMVFAGDLDAACDHLSTMWFVEELGLNQLSEYDQWIFDEVDGTKQIGGYASYYSNLSYVTVRGAGHFVPTDRPVPAYEMWRTFLLDEPLN